MCLFLFPSVRKPPPRNDPATLWFGKDQTFQAALARRARESIRAMGGAVQRRRYGYKNDEVVLPNLEHLDLRQSGWKNVEGHCFCLLQKLVTVDLPAALEDIGEDAFDSDAALAEIQFPETLKVVGERAFYGCSGLKEVGFPPGFERLGWCSFSHSNSLQKVKLPSAMKRIGGIPFDGCVSLKTLVVGDVEEWEVYSNYPEWGVLGERVRLTELRLIGWRWETVPPLLALHLAKDARVIGPNFVGRKLGDFVVVGE
jgi:hypothetical protein